MKDRTDLDLRETPLAWSPDEVAHLTEKGVLARMSRRQLAWLAARSDAVAALAREHLALMPAEQAAPPDYRMTLEETAKLLGASSYVLEGAQYRGKLVTKECGRLGVWRSAYDAFVKRGRR